MPSAALQCLSINYAPKVNQTGEAQKYFATTNSYRV